jgi:AcrR family transcriptional regulator
LKALKIDTKEPPEGAVLLLPFGSARAGGRAANAIHCRLHNNTVIDGGLHNNIVNKIAIFNKFPLINFSQVLIAKSLESYYNQIVSQYDSFYRSRKKEGAPLQARKITNKNKVILHALRCFIERGIDATTIAEIAENAGLTERSVYRYFDSKSDLVLETALLFWEDTVKQANALYDSGAFSSLCGAEQIGMILRSYAALYFTDPEKLIFVHEAEIYLCKHDMSGLNKNKPPAPYHEFSAPLAKAIRHGIEDGSVRNDPDIELLYNNAYDALLGLIQKMSINDSGGAGESREASQKRLESFCDLLTKSFTG